MNITRRVAIMAAGACLALVTVAVAAPASAASTNATTQASVTFIDTSGVTITCTVTDYTKHNTDNAAQPTTNIQQGLAGSGPNADECLTNVQLTVTATYNDKSGVTRTTTSVTYTQDDLTIGGTYTPINTTVNAFWYSCDSAVSASCTATTPAAHPK